jgi:tRNA nucleotidyltransferase (CCA-adding enzyme)
MSFIGFAQLAYFLGPRPHLALSTIHRLGLYNTIFTDPGWTSSQMADTTHWPQACNQLRTLVCGDSEAARVVASILECNDATSKQEHPAQCWLLCALVPWARIDGPHAGNAKVKHGWPVAASVAREGLKVNNKSTAMIKNAVLHIDEIIATKDAFCRRPKDTTVPIKRKQEMISREAQGMSIRRWGAGWRSSTLFALLVESTGTENEQGMAHSQDL